MDVREISCSDWFEYYELRIQSEKEYPEYVGFNVERELNAGYQNIKSLLLSYRAEGTIVFGAFYQNELVGVSAVSRRLSKKYSHKAFLWGVYVKPGFRGAGVADLLMNNVISWASKILDLMAINLQVTFSNIRGMKFYNRFGFVNFGSEQNSLYAAGKFHGVHYMELCIKRVSVDEAGSEVCVQPVKI